MWTALIDQLAAVFHAFRHNKGRSLLTLLGMIIGSGSVVLLSGLLAGGEGALESANQFIDDAAVIEVETADAPPQQRGRTQRPLSTPDEAAIQRTPRVFGGDAVRGAGVDEKGDAVDADWEPPKGAGAEGELFDWRKWARVEDRKKRVMVLGASAQSKELYRVELAQGRYIDERDLRTRARVCVVGDEVFRELLGEPKDLKNANVRIGGVRWEVVGVLKRKPPLNAGPGVWMWDRRIVVPATTFQGAVRHSRKVDSIYIRVMPGVKDLQKTLEASRGLLRALVARLHYGVENFRIDSDKGEKQQGELIFLIINVLTLCTAALSLFVGGINIMNIMLVTVTERTREIGIRRALGATPGNILRQFLLESAIIAGLGGLMGVIGGMGLVFLVSKGLAAWLGSWTAHYKLWAIALGLCSSTLTGVIFGLYPAWRAAHLEPVAALRYE